jgi:ChrR-like protein with cupin domain
MTKSSLTITILALLLICSPFRAACDPANLRDTASAPATPATSGKWLIATLKKIAWRPTNLLPPGVQIAVLEGDPSKAGFFTMRLKVPDGYRFPAHWHSDTERVTILSGTLYLGIGDGSNHAAAVPLGAGTYSSMPPRTPHFAWTRGETVLQLSSLGPWTLTYVNPADDPRR